MNCALHIIKKILQYGVQTLDVEDFIYARGHAVVLCKVMQHILCQQYKNTNNTVHNYLSKKFLYKDSLNLNASGILIHKIIIVYIVWKV
jgi:hypothetical protein